MADNIRNALTPRIFNGKITCANAHQLAQDIKVAPRQIGVAIDICEARITACQLGLFGRPEPDPSGPLPAALSETLEQAILAASKSNAITCLQAWQVGDAQGVTRRQVGHTCNLMGIKVNRCQLGAF